MSENLQYWINQNGTQSGPHTIEQLESMAFDKAHTYVWHKGMDGWKRIDKIPELAHLAAAPEPVEPQESPAEPLETDAEAIADEPQEAPGEEQAAAPVPPEYVEPEVQVPPFMPQMQSQPPQMQSMQAPASECPPTNLVAAIVCAVLCCTPLAVVAIVLAVMTKNKYRAGEYEKAQKYSEWGAWLCILSIVSTFLFMPFSMLVL